MQRRVSTLVVATTSTVVIAFVTPMCLLVRTLAEDRAMATADQAARNVAILVSGLHGTPQLAALVEEIDTRGVPTTEVLTPDGQQIGGGPNLADDPELSRARAGNAFTVIDESGGRVLLPVIVEEGTYIVRSSIAPDDLHRGVLAAWIGIISAGVLLILLAMLFARQLAGKISEPLRKVAHTAVELREGNLAARADVGGPQETRELAIALNGLADRIVELLAAERAAVAELSHRLRTPVTALRLDIESVSDANLSGRLQQHVSVLQRTIDAIVNEARQPVRTDLRAVCEAGSELRQRLEFWRPLAEDQGREIALDLGSEPVFVRMHGQDLRDLSDVLIDNVFAHTPEGVPFAVSLRQSGDVALLTVSDSGPGFAAPARDQRVGSTGLGLEIARRAADACGGSMTIGSSPSGGAQVELRLPVSAAPMLGVDTRKSSPRR